MRILLVKTSSLGDVVHNLPVASDLARRFPDAAIDWVVEESFADLPRLHPAIARVLPVAVRRWRRRLLSRATWTQIGAARDALREHAYDLVLDTQGLLKSGLIAAQARLAPGGRRCGYDRDSAREAVAARFYDAGFAIPRQLHAVERNRRLAAAASGHALDMTLDYGIAARPLAAGWLPHRDYAVLLTATSRADKLWPDPDWQALGMALIATGLTCVLPGGSGEERQRAARLATTLGRAVATPPLGLADMAGLLAGAQLVVGVDTGLVHLAAALGRPTLALFCASDPALTGVHAGPQAINLGKRGTAPTAGAVVAAALELIACGAVAELD
ncbi:MAG: lipopolysaccharide heptosyltransferase I [Rhodocyclales bacterium GWA2_65_20]|nr:MAG: lipopolysaccharide heptosyltransferase I [Rhodocyclales bacterium GWA2_65_20]